MAGSALPARARARASQLAHSGARARLGAMAACSCWCKCFATRQEGRLCETLKQPVTRPPRCTHTQQMATKPVAKEGVEVEGAQVHRIRITLTSRNVKNLEKGA